VKDFCNYLAKQSRNYLNGKIDWYSCGWIFSDKGYTNQQGVHFKALESDDGRMVSLNPKRSVKCPDSSKGDFPLVRGSYSVPKSVCDKCLMKIQGGYCKKLRSMARGDVTE